MNRTSKLVWLGVSTILLGASYLYVQERRKKRELEAKRRRQQNRLNGTHSDAKKLCNDWENVGKDIRKSIEDYEEAY